MFGDGMAHTAALDWHAVTFPFFFPPTSLDFCLSQSSESRKSKACRGGSQEASDAEGMIERISQVSLKTKSKAKMKRGKERRKKRDFIGFKASCLILCGLIHNRCMPGVGSSTSGSHQ